MLAEHTRTKQAPICQDKELSHADPQHLAMQHALRQQQQQAPHPVQTDSVLTTFLTNCQTLLLLLALLRPTCQLVLDKEGAQPPVQCIQAARLHVHCLLQADHHVVVGQVGQDEAQQP